MIKFAHMSGLQTKGRHLISRNSAENALNRTPQLILYMFDIENQLIIRHFVILR